MPKKTRLGSILSMLIIVATVVVLMLGLSGTAAAHDPGQHGTPDGHLLGSGDEGNIEFVSKLEVTQTPDLVADVAVSPDGQWAFLANWGEPDCAGPETGGQNTPDAGAWVIDISDLEAPELVGFIPSHQDTRPGEGMQVVNITTPRFSGNVLVMNNEQCGKNGKGGVSLWDVTNPLNPRKLSEHFGDRSAVVNDTNDIHSAFAWDAGDKAYVVVTDNFEFPDVDILDITNPKRPRLIAEYDLNLHDVDQPEIGLTDSFLHDMVVKKIGDDFIMLLSYWDGGYVMLNVNDPANAVFIRDTDFNNPDPELLESAGIALTPEGNAHQAEFTLNNNFFIGTDEDFAPYRPGDFRITTGPHQGIYPAVIVPGAAAPAILPDLTLNGPVVYGGYGCPDSAPVPQPEDVEGYLDLIEEGEEKIIVLQRGPVGDPSAPEEACFPGEKAHEAVEAGWDAVLFVQRHGGAENPPFCGSGAFVDVIVGVCTNHETYHKLFDTPPFDPADWTYPDGPAVGTIGEEIEVGSIFDGWGYVHLFDSETFTELDTYAIDEAHEEEFAIGYGDLSVHEVATDPQSNNQAYLSYYSGGIRSLEIQGTELVEVGSYLDPEGNDFWGVEAFVRDGKTIILGSDRDSGLWIFRVTD